MCMHATTCMWASEDNFWNVVLWVTKPSLTDWTASTLSHWTNSSVEQRDFELVWKQASEGANENLSLEWFNWMGKNYTECTEPSILWALKNWIKEKVNRVPTLFLLAWAHMQCLQLPVFPLLCLIYCGPVIPLKECFHELLLLDFFQNRKEGDGYKKEVKEVEEREFRKVLLYCIQNCESTRLEHPLFNSRFVIGEEP